MGEAGAADPSRIPDFSRNADPNWTTVHDRLPIAAHYQLMVENLIDLSHLAFVHAKTIGTDDTRTALRFDRGEDFVRVVREPVEVDTAPHNLKQGMGPRSRLEKTIHFTSPSHVVIDIRTTEVAAQKNDPISLGITVLNACTPETESSTHYFWASARDYQRDDKQLDAFLYKVTVEAFNEDKDMLEAQQRCIALDFEAPYVSVNADWGSVQMRRLMSDLIERERGGTAIAAQ
jgi:vanillate O-demethylase monooxygenase subunit